MSAEVTMAIITDDGSPIPEADREVLQDGLSAAQAVSMLLQDETRAWTSDDKLGDPAALHHLRLFSETFGGAFGALLVTTFGPTMARLIILRATMSGMAVVRSLENPGQEVRDQEGASMVGTRIQSTFPGDAEPDDDGSVH